MASFAKLGVDNIVTDIVHVDTIDNMTSGGIEKEEIGIAHLTKHHGHENWRQCSYNTLRGQHLDGKTPFRANYPGIGWYYDSTNDIFYEPRPTDMDGESCASWTLNTTTGHYDPPITRPTETEQMITDGKKWKWDESAHQADNTTGWVSVQQPVES